MLLASKTFHWTAHSRAKMRQYRLSESRVKRVLNSPKRVEEGIAPNTTAMMQPASLKSFGKEQKWKQEIWVMVQEMKHGAHSMKHDAKKVKIISAWRYPGVTKPRDEVTKELLQERFREYLKDWER